VDIFAPNTVSLVLLIGVLASGLLVLLSTVRLVLKKPQARSIHAIVALMICIAIVVGTVGNSFPVLRDLRGFLATLLMGLLSLIAGIGIFLGERKLAHFDSGRSQGLLLAGIGIFTLACTIIVPTLPMQFTLPPPTLASSPAPTITRTPLPTRTPRETTTPTSLPTLTTIPSALPTLTTTPTYQGLSLPTSILPTATLSPTPLPCTVEVLSNVNLRTGPSTDYKLIMSIPFTSILPVTARSADKVWWQVIYKDQQGWVSGQFVDPDPGCETVPTVAAP
jgi:hypothetical protein